MEVPSLDGLAIGQDPLFADTSATAAPLPNSKADDCAISAASTGTTAPITYFDTVGRFVYVYVYVCQLWNAL